MANERTRVEPWPGAASINKRIPYGWHTRGMVATIVGKSKDRIKQWEKDGDITPDGEMPLGQLVIPLYSFEAVEHVRKVASTKRPGPKPKQHQEEAKDQDHETSSDHHQGGL